MTDVIWHLFFFFHWPPPPAFCVWLSSCSVAFRWFRRGCSSSVLEPLIIENQGLGGGAVKLALTERNNIKSTKAESENNRNSLHPSQHHFWVSLNVSVGLSGKPCRPDSRVENAQLAVKVQHTLSGTREEFGAARQLSAYGSGSAPVYISCKPKWHFFSSVIRVNAIGLPQSYVWVILSWNLICCSSRSRTTVALVIESQKIHLLPVVNLHHHLEAAVNHWVTSLFRPTCVFLQGQWDLGDTYGKRVKNIREMG